MVHPVLTHCLRTKGGLLSSYVFENDAQVLRWKKDVLPELEAK
jgi:hypothetical protein